MAVSSILKALKKIEETTLAAGPADPKPASGPQRSWRPRPGRRRNRLLVIAGVVAASAVAAAGFFIFGRGSGGESPPAMAGAAAGTNAVRAKIGAAADTAADAPSVRRETAGPVAAGGPAAAPPAVMAPPPLPKRPTAQALPARPGARPAPREAPGAPTTDRAPRPAPKAAARSAEDNLSRLDNSKLKVMAIAWYTDPARRIAVINGSMVKEGESVEGYKVSQIRKDDVIVSDGSRSWRVEFGLKAPQ
jgi:hypothetical protein